MPEKIMTKQSNALLIFSPFITVRLAWIDLAAAHTTS